MDSSIIGQFHDKEKKMKQGEDDSFLWFCYRCFCRHYAHLFLLILSQFLSECSSDLSVWSNLQAGKWKRVVIMIFLGIKQVSIKTYRTICGIYRACFRVYPSWDMIRTLRLRLFMIWARVFHSRDFHHWEEPYHHRWRITIIFSRVLDVANQLLTRHSLYSAPWMNDNAFFLWNMKLESSFAKGFSVPKSFRDFRETLAEH